MATEKISASVGKGGKNKPDDVKKIQLKLNEHKSAGKYQALKPDGKFGKKTQAAIETFQLKVLAGKKDGIINPGKATLGGLNCKPGQVGGDDAGPKGKLKAGAKAGAKGGEDADDEGGDAFDPVEMRKMVKKIARKPFKFAFAVSTKIEDCKLVFKLKGDSKVFGMMVKKKTGQNKVTWGVASQDPEDKQTMLLNIEGKQLPMMEKMGKKLLKRDKLMPFKKIRLMVDGAPVDDVDEEEAEAAPAGRDKSKSKEKPAEIPKKVQETLIKAPAIWHDTRRSIAKSLTQLKNAIRKAFKSEGREAIAEVDKNMKAIDDVLVKLDKRLSESLEKAGEAKDRQAFEVELKNTQKLLKQYANYAASDPLINHLDSNPFGTKTELKKTITSSLQQVRKVIDSASKAA